MLLHGPILVASGLDADRSGCYQHIMSILFILFFFSLFPFIPPPPPVIATTLSLEATAPPVPAGGPQDSLVIPLAGGIIGLIVLILMALLVIAVCLHRINTKRKHIVRDIQREVQG